MKTRTFYGDDRQVIAAETLGKHSVEILTWSPSGVVLLSAEDALDFGEQLVTLAKKQIEASSKER